MGFRVRTAAHAYALQRKLGCAVAAELAGSRVSVADLARAIHLDRSALHAKLRGDSPFSLHQLVAVGAALDVSVRYLVGETVDRAPATAPIRDAAAELPGIDAQAGARVHQLLFVRRVSVSQLAQVLGVDRTSVSQRLHAVVPFRVAELQRISHALGGTIGYFVGEVGFAESRRPSEPARGPDGRGAA